MENQWQSVGIHAIEPSKISALAKVDKNCQLVKHWMRQKQEEQKDALWDEIKLIQTG